MRSAAGSAQDGRPGRKGAVRPLLEAGVVGVQCPAALAQLVAATMSALPRLWLSLRRRGSS